MLLNNIFISIVLSTFLLFHFFLSFSISKILKENCSESWTKKCFCPQASVLWNHKYVVIKNACKMLQTALPSCFPGSPLEHKRKEKKNQVNSGDMLEELLKEFEILATNVYLLSLVSHQWYSHNHQWFILQQLVLMIW